MRMTNGLDGNRQFAPTSSRLKFVAIDPLAVE